MAGWFFRPKAKVESAEELFEHRQHDFNPGSGTIEFQRRERGEG